MAVERFKAYDEVYDFLTSSPIPQQIITFRPSAETQERIRFLLDANNTRNLTADEAIELDEFGKVEHLMRMLKVYAHEKRNSHNG